MRRATLPFMILLAAGAPPGARGPGEETRNRLGTIAPPNYAPGISAGTLSFRAVRGPLPPLTSPVTSFAKPLSFAVPAHSMWETSVGIKGWWGAPTVVAVHEADVDVAIHLLPTGVVTGTLITPTDAMLAPKSLSVLL